MSEAEARASLPVAGRITAAASAGLALGSLQPQQPVAGRITAAASAGLALGSLQQFVAGSITANVSARLVTPPQIQPVGGSVTIKVSGYGILSESLSGSIQAAVSASLDIGRVFAARASYSANVTIAFSATATPQVSTPPGVLFGSITTAVTAQLDDGAVQVVAPITGQTQIAFTLQGDGQPWQPILVGNIFTAVQAAFADAEVQFPPPPPPSPFPTYDTEHYLDLVTSEHNQRPKYMATVGITVDPVVSDQQLAAGVFGLFDLDYCAGQQEDFTGQWIGKSRWIELPVPFFTWDDEGLGWNQTNWKGPSDAPDRLQRLDDYHYRLLLYANIIANHWNGSIPGAYEAWDTLFRYVGIKVIIQDYGNMTMLYGLLSDSIPDIVLLSLFTTGQMDLRPEGVQLLAYALQPTPGVPFFAWDASSDSVHGWDNGYWAIMMPPGQVYVPASLHDGVLAVENVTETNGDTDQ